MERPAEAIVVDRHQFASSAAGVRIAKFDSQAQNSIYKLKEPKVI